MTKFFGRKTIPGLALFCAYLLLHVGTASAAKVEMERTNGRIMPAPILLVGTYDGQNRPDICIVDRAGIAAAVGGRKKIYVYVSLAPERQTSKNIESSGAFTINMPGSGHIAETDFCGTVSAVSGDLYIDKFGITGLTPQRADLVDAPMVREFPVSMECKVVRSKTFGEGSHRMYIAEVLRVWIDEDVMNGPQDRFPGYPNPKKARTVVYSPGGGEGYGYYEIGELLGRPESLYESKYPNGPEVAK